MNLEVKKNIQNTIKIAFATLTKITVWFEMPHKNHDCQSMATREHKCCTFTTNFRRKNSISLTFKETTEKY